MRFIPRRVKVSLKVILHPRLNPFSLDFSDNIPCTFLTSAMHSTGPAHLIRIDLIIIGQIGYCERHSCNFLNTTGSQLQTSSVLLPSTFIISDLWGSYSVNYLERSLLGCDAGYSIRNVLTFRKIMSSTLMVLHLWRTTGCHSTGWGKLRP
jgi:hypothetical protein